MVEKLKRINKKRKYAIDQSLKDLKTKQPIFAFFDECLKQLAADLPFFEKIENHALVIKGQKLSSGHCEAISKACKVLSLREKFERFSLRDVGIQDE